MKYKILKSVIFLASVLFIAGCESAKKDGSILITGESISIEKSNFYDYMVASRGESIMEEFTLVSILRERFPLEKEVIEKAFLEEKERFVNFEDTLKAQNKTEFEIRQQIELELMLQKAIKEDADVSDKTLEMYYEIWEPKTVYNQIVVNNEETAKKIKEDIDSGKAFSEILESYAEEKEPTWDNILKIDSTSYIDKTLQEKIVQLTTIGDSDIVSIENLFFVIQLVNAGEKTDFETDKKDVKNDYLEQQFTSYNKEKVIMDLVKEEKLNIKDETFKNIFSRFNELEES